MTSQTTYLPQTSTFWATALGDRHINYSMWNGNRLRRWIALDTETTVITGDDQIPQLVVVSVSDGVTHALLTATDLLRFLEAHQDSNLVMWNAAFDFWVLVDSLGTQSSRLWDMLDRGLVWCTMTLEALLRLAWNDDDRVESVADVTSRRLGIELAKGEDTWRLRYGELIGIPLAQWPAAARDYAIRDAVATMEIFQQQWQDIERLKIEHYRDDLGPLTVTLQTKSAISLAEVSRRGMHIDRAYRDAAYESLRQSIFDRARTMEAIADRKVFKYWRSGFMRTGGKADIPSKDMESLRSVLKSIVDEHGLDVPTTPTGKLSTSIKQAWRPHVDVHPFLTTWAEYEEHVKLLGFFSSLHGDEVHPRYRMVRTGRTACSKPNVQQMPRSGDVRRMFVPSGGHLFLAVDYSYIELATLAVVCEARYGESRLADTLREGTDPHEFTGARLAGMDLDAFRRLKSEDGAVYKEWRQRAKAVNFGIPGGLSAHSLAAYAKATYGVDMTIDQASNFRDVHIQQTFPELSQYLSEDCYAILANSLQTTVDIVRRTFPSEAALGYLRRLVRGETAKRDGEGYAPGHMAEMWIRLSTINQCPELRIRQVDAGPKLYRRMFTTHVETTTGRVRAHVPYTAARNSPFQGLAADGMREALYRLMRASYRVVACIHDEVLVELPIGGDHRAMAEDISRIMRESMQYILQSDIPIRCEYALMERWEKGAEAVFNEAGQLVPWLGDT